MKKSNCCNAPMQVMGNTTKYYVCDSCQKACDERVEDTLLEIITNEAMVKKAARYSSVSQEIQMMIWDYMKKDIADRDAVAVADKIIKLVLKNKDKL